MLTAKQASWKNESNAKKWCELKNMKYHHYGAWDVFYQTPEQIGVKVNIAFGTPLKDAFDAVSSITWLQVFKDLGLE